MGPIQGCSYQLFRAPVQFRAIGFKGFVVQRGGLRRDLGLLLKALAARRRHTVLVEI